MLRVDRVFHGDNTGSNPVGDAKQTNNLQFVWLPFRESVTLS
jgi:hypothetical protein